jgi:hypothetical protein
MSDLRKGQVRLGPRSWGAIREAYLSGTSAAALAEAYGCSLGTIRYRAVREGWRRCDVAEDGLAQPRQPQPTAPAKPPSLSELTDLALSYAMRALVAGRPGDAAAYLRVAEAGRRLGLADNAPSGAPSGAMEMITQEEIDARREELDERIARIQATIEMKQARYAAQTR